MVALAHLYLNYATMFPFNIPLFKGVGSLVVGLVFINSHPIYIKAGVNTPSINVSSMALGGFVMVFFWSGISTLLVKLLESALCLPFWRSAAISKMVPWWIKFKPMRCPPSRFSASSEFVRESTLYVDCAAWPWSHLPRSISSNLTFSARQHAAESPGLNLLKRLLYAAVHPGMPQE